MSKRCAVLVVMLLFVLSSTAFAQTVTRQPKLDNHVGSNGALKKDIASPNNGEVRPPLPKDGEIRPPHPKDGEKRPPRPKDGEVRPPRPGTQPKL